MKTFSQYMLETLTPAQYKQFTQVMGDNSVRWLGKDYKQDFLEHDWNVGYGIPDHEILDSFVWHTTKQGQNYWKGVYESIGGEL